MSGANSFKFVLLPPQSDTTRDWAKRLAKIVSEARVLVIGGGSPPNLFDIVALFAEKITVPTFTPTFAGIDAHFLYPRE